MLISRAGLTSAITLNHEGKVLIVVNVTENSNYSAIAVSSLGYDPI